MRSLRVEEIKRHSPASYRNTTKKPFVVVLDNVRSRNNVGSVFRSMDAFAGTKLYLGGITPIPPHRDIHKTALGAEEVVDWQQGRETIEVIKHLKEGGYQVIAIEHTDQSSSLADFSYQTDKKYAFVFGNEVTGVSQAVLDHCDLALEIPQFGTKHSLNISVSVGVVLWHLMNQLIESPI